MSHRVKRPLYLRQRQTRHTFGVEAQLVRETGSSYNGWGEWSPGTQDTYNVVLSTAPSSSGLARTLADGDGIRLGGMRDFYYDEYAQPSPPEPEPVSIRLPRSGDRIVYEGSWYRVATSANWGDGFHVVTASYEDPQPRN